MSFKQKIRVIEFDTDYINSLKLIVDEEKEKVSPNLSMRIFYDSKDKILRSVIILKHGIMVVKKFYKR
jgi:hypothetical protein